MKKEFKFTLNDVAGICSIVALPIALGLALWFVGGVALFVAGLLARPHIDSWLGGE